jgi:hypothetical protein
MLCYQRQTHQPKIYQRLQRLDLKQVLYPLRKIQRLRERFVWQRHIFQAHQELRQMAELGVQTPYIEPIARPE